MRILILSAVLITLGCATTEEFARTPGLACYRLEADDSSSDAGGTGGIPSYLVLDSAGYPGTPPPRDTLHAYHTGTKRSPFWRQSGDSVFVFSPITKFAQLKFRFEARSDDLVGEAWYSADIETDVHDMIPVTATRVACRPPSGRG